MPNWLVEASKLLGFTTPFVYAAATYALFHYLDTRASGEAKKAISQWLRNAPLDHETISNSLLELFDRIYSKPLTKGGALVRSAGFSTFVTLAFLYELGALPAATAKAMHSGVAGGFGLGLVGFNIISDYLSLFVIRHFLALGRNRPVTALLVGSAFGSIFVFAVFLFGAMFGAMLYGLATLESFPDILARVLKVPPTTKRLFFEDAIFQIVFIAGLVVHLWLVIFAISIIAARLIRSILATLMQWFLKQGQYHPLDAVGYIAATIVFVTALVGQLVIH